MGVVGEIDVVRDRPRVEGLQHRERRTGIEDHRLADVLQREPDLLAVRCRRNIGTERAGLGYPSDDLVIRHGDHNGLGVEGGADHRLRRPVAREGHGGRSRAHHQDARDDDARLLLIAIAVEDGDVVLPADRDPDLLAVRGEEGLVRRPADVRDVLHRVGRSVDERHGVRAD